MSIVDQRILKDMPQHSGMAFKLPGNVADESKLKERKIEQLKFLVSGVSNEECIEALEKSQYNINNAANLLIDKNNDDYEEPNEKIKISDEIKKKYGHLLSFFEIAQVLLLCNNDEEEAISILDTMV
ncbi:hypothetical protein GPJ56_008844 [Histomonas meleagridis]|uniref:uncharacterized protein n=1 Tax=Histomonas meleagridis TaxID=135588 RepID=UPI003559A6F8|nr:hypothetical protein GPJ56_008844 [Histomonas meleagridis]KAH0805363.1 hypothetical protein GO595_001745 [Histomonas meleagridis]